MKFWAHNIRLLFATGCVMFTLSCCVPAFAAPEDFGVEPHRIRITESFHGRTVHISAQIPHGAQAVVELTGERQTENLLLKGRRWGLWMTVGEIEVHRAPSLSLTMTTDPQLLTQQGPEEKWGFGELRREIKISGTLPKAAEAELFSEYLKLKESEGLYGEFPDALKVVARHDRLDAIQGQLKLPGNIKPGYYVFSLTVLKDGKVVEHKTIHFEVVMRQLAALLFSLAQQHPTLYGFLAVAIAMSAGLLTGFVFKGKGAH